MGQYPDGLRGPLIVEDTSDPYANQYTEDVTITVSDWYHDESPGLINNMLSSSNPNALPPFPDAVLINDASSFSFTPIVNTTYKVRIVNVAAFGAVILAIDSHTAEIIEVDGVYTDKYEASQIRISPAQRYTFLLTTKADSNTNYAFTAILDENPDFTASATWPLNATGYLNYNTGDEAGAYTVDTINPMDDFDLVPYDGQSLIGDPDQTVTLNFNFGLDSSSIPR